MKWYFQIRGGHTHVRVYMNNGKCGDLCFRNEEFEVIRAAFPERQGLKDAPEIIHFISDDISEAIAE